MRSLNRWIGIVVGVAMGTLFSVVVVLAGSLEPSEESTAAGSQTYNFLPLVMSSGGGICSAGVPRTGQTPTIPINPAPAGSDGALQKGLVWPSPRFTDNANGTVTDNLTGLIWLKDANCTNFFSGDNTGLNNRNWANALTAANLLGNGSCGLTDGSTGGNWRLPNVREMQSLIDYGRSYPPLPSLNPFTGVQSDFYWSGTTFAGLTSLAWAVSLSSGYMFFESKTDSHYVWPVRGGQ
jgi:hypothetical protein